MRDNQACTGRVTLCYSLTSWTTELWSVMLNGHAWVDRVWVRSYTLPIESDRGYQPFANLELKPVWLFASIYRTS